MPRTEINFRMAARGTSVGIQYRDPDISLSEPYRYDRYAHAAFGKEPAVGMLDEPVPRARDSRPRRVFTSLRIARGTSHRNGTERRRRGVPAGAARK